jgi:hypothetical protein
MYISPDNFVHSNVAAYLLVAVVVTDVVPVDEAVDEMLVDAVVE